MSGVSMKRALIGLSVVFLGVGAFLVLGGDEPASPQAQALAAARADRVAVREAHGATRGLGPKDREANPPMAPRSGTIGGEPTPEQLAAAPFLSFSSKAAPRWQGVSLELKRLGHADLADETWTMAAWVRTQRTDPDRDDATIVEAQDELLLRVLAVPDLDPPAAEAVAQIKDTIRVYDSAHKALPEG